MDSFPAPQPPDPVTPRADEPEKPADPPARSYGDVEPDDSQLPPRTWLRRNGIYLLTAALLITLLYWQFGLQGMWSIILAGLGLGLVIFIHELGHFTMAKWCDVYVETFSIGFGPALPGCAFQWGETVYKIALFPLGGYVKMLGEGSESEDDENNPRSYRNKRVGQRMAIISAGVIMNVILACICFILVFFHGKDQPAGEIGWVEGGNRAWEKGVPSGAVLEQVGNRVATERQPLYFTDLQSAVIYSMSGEKILFRYRVYKPVGNPALPSSYQTETHAVELEPRKEERDAKPMIGVSPPECLDLPPKQLLKKGALPYLRDSAAAVAREAFPWHADDVVVATTDPDSPETLKDLDPPVSLGEGGGKQFELSRRWHALVGKPMSLRLRHGADAHASTEVLTLQARPFEAGDSIIATSDPDHPEQMLELPKDPRDPSGRRHDYFEFERRLQLLAGRTMLVRVEHAQGKGTADLVIPPAYHRTLGVRLRMGEVVGIRDDSAAATAGVTRGDILKEVVLKDGQGNTRTFALPKDNPREAADPVRLTYEMRQWADAHREEQKGVTAAITVYRDNPQTGQQRAQLTLPEVPWDYSWRFDREMPGSQSAPLAIPELGLAYRVETIVDDVDPDSPAANKLQKNDAITAIRFQRIGAQGEVEDSPWSNLEVKKGDTRLFNQGAQVFTLLQLQDVHGVTLRVERGGQTLEIPLTAGLDSTWPLADRGVLFMPDVRIQKADGFYQAVVMGLQDTYRKIAETYMSLRGIITGRVSFWNLGGPLTIGVVAYHYAGMGVWELLYFMGFISVNLAVINFLPIPFLDGGHMLFLIYEKIRGRPAREEILTTATIAGVLFLVLLMLAVSVIDIGRWVFNWWQ